MLSLVTPQLAEHCVVLAAHPIQLIVFGFAVTDDDEAVSSEVPLDSLEAILQLVPAIDRALVIPANPSDLLSVKHIGTL
jgi:hypothetical protein